ncbi:MAG: hypothetical protein ACI9X0_002714 [Kiritimatiellia bacterium]|jgi:hypothetical protein
MQTIALPLNPYEDSLYCPYCGTGIITKKLSDDCELGECKHLVYANVDESPDDENDSAFTPQSDDFCFSIHESAPADRNHYFVFRKSAEG